MKNRIQFLYALLAFVAAEAIQYSIVIFYQIAYGLVIGIRIGIKNGAEGISDTTSITDTLEKAMSQNIIYLISVIAVVCCGVAFFFWYRYETRGEARENFRRTFTGKNVALLIALGLGCQFFISGMMSVIQQYFVKLFSDYQKQMESLTGGNIIVVLFLMIIIAPITEELVFRGVILHKANRAISFLGANLLQAMLFGIYHMNIVQGIYAAFIGFLLGLVYYKFKTIYAPMLLHMAINTSSLLMVLFPNTIWTYYLLVFVGGVIMIAVFGLIKISKPVVIEKIEFPIDFDQIDQFEQFDIDRTNQK